MTQALPCFFLPHGAGPCFFMDWEPTDTWQSLARCLRELGEGLRASTRALLVVSAHWEEPVFTLNTAPRPGLLFDYYGFPPSTYQLSWPAPGAPELAGQVAELLAQQGIAHASTPLRGLDHGVFIPLMLAFPQADIPVLQLSLHGDLDPQAHLALGQALAPLRHEGVVIIGSGMSYHNMRRFRLQGGPADPDSLDFDAWLTQSLALPAAQRHQRLTNWLAAPGARAAHPREEHLMPLHVVAGAALEDPGERIFAQNLMASAQSAYQFGGYS
ncbi:MAG: dioxygenase [Chromatiales bacterium]|nr:dioxygenase [Gammaproteobacteria bacterium]MBW6477189.1 dioxygenase [Chromatiales bacterium]